MRNVAAIFLCFCLGYFSSYGNSFIHPEPQRYSEKKILFVGNSLIYSNDLPYLVSKEAKKWDIHVKTVVVAFPNYALMDHWEDKKVQDLITEGNFDFVLIQQGPSSQTFGREVLFEYGAKFQEICSASGAQLAFLMVWPSRQYYYTFPNVIKNYRDAAKSNNALLIPVGSRWKSHFDATGDFSYYSQDGFHPSKKGSQVAATFICETLFGTYDK